MTAQRGGLKTEIRGFLGQAAVLCVSGLLNRIYFVTDQIYGAKISTDALNAISMMNYVSIPSVVVGITLGQSMLILLNRDASEESRAQSISAAMQLTIPILVVICLAWFACVQPFTELLGVEHVAGIRAAQVCGILNAAVTGLNVLALFTMTALGRRNATVAWDFVGNILNLVGNYLSVTRLHDPGAQLLGVLATTLVVQSAYLAIMLTYLRKFLKVRTAELKRFWAGAKDFVVGDTMNYLMVYLAPLFYSLLFQNDAQKENVAAYNVGFRVYNLLAFPVVAVTISGTVWLSSAWSHRDRKEWSERVRFILLLALAVGAAPTALVLLGLRPMLDHLFKLRSQDAAIIAGAVILSALPVALTAHLVCQTRVFGKQRVLAFSNFFATYCLGLPAAFYFVRSGSYQNGALAGVLVPSIFLAAFLLFYKESLQVGRRLDPRHVVPDSMAIQVRVDRINDEPASIQLRLMDINKKGCGVIDSSRAKATKGAALPNSARVQGVILDHERRAIRFDGVVRVKPSSAATLLAGGFYLGGAPAVTGIQFAALGSEEWGKLEALISEMQLIQGL